MVRRTACSLGGNGFLTTAFLNDAHYASASSGKMSVSRGDSIQNPDAFYCAAPWDYQDVPRNVLRHCFMKLSSTSAAQSIFARPVDWGPNERTKRVLDISPGAAKALAVRTDDTIRGDLVLPVLA
jgi:hypothetical protein